MTRDLYRGINEFKKRHQPATNVVKDENGDLLADSHNISNLWKNYYCQLFNEGYLVSTMLSRLMNH
jgi:hypothetical protein